MRGINMKDNLILHLMILDKFIPPFIEFLLKNFDTKNHKFVILGSKDFKFGLKEEWPIIFIDKKIKYIKLFYLINKSNQIIIHGLWNERLVQLLLLQPWVLKKCYHVMWGGDFYFPEQQSLAKRELIKRIGNFITYIDGDYEYVKKFYEARGKYHKCFMYPSNIFKDYNITTKKENNIINIQVGNSATETNQHLKVFDIISKFKDKNIKIFCPISYGNKEYAKEVEKRGKELFGDKFIAINEFMPYERYFEFLANIDIAIFFHNRQQGMGNTINLLGMGKKVYLNKNTPQYKLFESLGVKVYDFEEEFNLEIIDEEVNEKNQRIIRKYFSEENLKKQLKNIFEGG